MFHKTIIRIQSLLERAPHLTEYSDLIDLRKVVDGLSRDGYQDFMDVMMLEFNLDLYDYISPAQREKLVGDLREEITCFLVEVIKPDEDQSTVV